MPSTYRLRAAVLAGSLTVAALASTGCGATTDDPTTPTTESSMTTGYGHGPLEDAIVRMKHMRAEMIGALDQKIEHKHWAPIVNQEGVSSSGCNDNVSQTVTLRIYGTDDTFPAAKWQDAAAIVETIGRKYGFDVVNRTVDEPGNLVMTGLAPDGGSYTFGMEKAMDLTVQTGCYRWRQQPGPDAWQTLDPVPGSPLG